jgi:superfamily II DNA or RNA helicase/diadenosine tetraphosphate (Ap4A) HIT family hydrolase
MTSPFLERPESDWIASNDLAFAIFDGFPVSPGHTLIIPKRLVPTWFEATPEEQRALMALVEVVKARLDAEYHPDGYNIGINAGEAAGQTVFHLHVHLIPRYRGDMDDPRGGVRHVIPWKGNYKREALPRLATGETDPFLAHLLPHFETATDIAILAAFVQDSGLDRLETPILAARNRGAKIRLLTGDYLDITQARALRRLLGWATDGLSARVFETQPERAAFHPKSWRFESAKFGLAFVGSSNISASALGRGIEWNLRLDRHEDPAGWAALCASYDALWARATPLTPAWVEAYEHRTRVSPEALPAGEVEPPAPPPSPHAIQHEALLALSKARAEGRRRALVVLATGLGKTWLAAFDLAASCRDLGRPPRVLFIAHRDELLTQAADTYRRLAQALALECTFGFCRGPSDDLDADIVLASVQKVSREPWLSRLTARPWDHVVVDEVHHATAPSYKRILARLDAGFTLGLTATPDRQDEADVLGLFDDHLAFRADLDRGIAEDLLTPFKYLGIRDTIDFETIPWRNRRFDPDALARAAQTEQRMTSLWAAWKRNPGRRTLIFCASIAHATFVARWLGERGVRAVALHSGPGSADRREALTGLRLGTLDALCAVDLFSEGVDLPDLDRVVMLRPTESPVLFLQQLGRGLRKAPHKPLVTVIDFVGNHRVFLDRIARLVSFGGSTAVALAKLLAGEKPALPPGCSVELEVEAIDLLRRLYAGKSELERAYLLLSNRPEGRPRLVELERLGVSPAAVRTKTQGWFDFVLTRGDLSRDEARVLDACRPWLRELETSNMSKSFKLVLLQALLDADALTTGMAITELSRICHGIIARSPELMLDLVGIRELPNPLRPDMKAWERYWRKNPVAAWTQGTFFGLADREGVPWFEPRIEAPPGLTPTLVEMTQELVDYRLAQYRSRPLRKASTTVEAAVGWRNGDPVLRLDAKGRAALDKQTIVIGGLPHELRADGKDGVLLLSTSTTGPRRNRLPDLLRGWFGPEAGRTELTKLVRFAPDPEGWHLEPIEPLAPFTPAPHNLAHSNPNMPNPMQPIARVVSLADHRRAVADGFAPRDVADGFAPPAAAVVRAFPNLRAAAGGLDGHSASQDGAAIEATVVAVPTDRRWAADEDVFLVRASGDSMDGGVRPIKDGDWVALRWARGLGLGALEGRVALVEVEDPVDGHGWQLKRVVRSTRGHELRSDNPARPSFPARPQTTPIAVLVDILSPAEVISD